MSVDDVDYSAFSVVKIQVYNVFNSLIYIVLFFLRV